MARARHNPTKTELEQIEMLVRQGMSNKQVAQRLNMAVRTVQRAKDKLGLKGFSQKKDPDPNQVRIAVLAEHALGYGPVAIAANVDFPISEKRVREIIVEHERKPTLKAKLGERVLDRVRQRMAEKGIDPEDPLADLQLAQQVADDIALYNYAIASSKMLLLPAQDATQEQLLDSLKENLDDALRRPPRGVGSAEIEGRRLADELKEVAAFSAQMIMGAKPSAYRAAYEEGGFRGMFDLAQRVVGQAETPIEAQAIQELLWSVRLAQTTATAGRGRMPTVDELSEEYQAAFKAAHRDAMLRARAEGDIELSRARRLRNLARRGKVDKVREELEKEREAVASLTGPVRRWSEQRLRNVVWEVLRSEALRGEAREALIEAVQEDPERLKRMSAERERRRWLAYQAQRERAKRFIVERGEKPTQKYLDEVMEALGWPEKPRKPKGARKNPTLSDRVAYAVSDGLAADRLRLNASPKKGRAKRKPKLNPTFRRLMGL